MTADKRDPSQSGSEKAGETARPPTERRSSGILRIPYVRRSRLEFEGGGKTEAFIVNINVLGAYVALDQMPEMGQRVSCHFGVPGSDREIKAQGVVAWVNPRQAHPVHSLPPGFGIKFEQISDADRSRIARLVREYIAQHAQGRRRR